MAPNKPASIMNRKSKPIEKRIEYPLYFLACEGGSEICYFSGLQRYLLGKGIKINIKYLDRDFSQRDQTSPQDLLNLIYLEKDSADFGEVTVEKIVRKVDTWMREEKIIPDNSLKNVFDGVADKIISRMEQRHHYSLSPVKFSELEDGTTARLFEDLDICIKSVLADTITEYSIDDFKIYLKNKLGNFGFKDGDRVCIICDRDFYDESMYDAVLTQCKENNIDFIITNPCFEFWILLHFDDVLNIQHDKLLSNDMVSIDNTGKNERFTLREVQRLFPEYQKSNVHFSLLQDKIQHAIDYEKMFFSEDEIELKSDIGSRLGILVSELLSH